MPRVQIPAPRPFLSGSEARLVVEPIHVRRCAVSLSRRERLSSRDVLDVHRLTRPVWPIETRG
jgi:hypothetical protein